MSTKIRPATLRVVPESIDGLLSVFQDICVKLGTVALDIDGYETFRDASYLGTVKDTIDELEVIVWLTQHGLLMAKCVQEVQS